MVMLTKEVTGTWRDTCRGHLGYFLLFLPLPPQGQSQSRCALVIARLMLVGRREGRHARRASTLINDRGRRGLV